MASHPTAILMRALSGLGARTAGAVLVGGGKVVERVQALLRLQAPYRPLTAEELEVLRRVFAGSVPLERIRVVQGRAGIFGVNDRAFTLGTTIYLKERYSLELLVHECAHVWQYVHLGPRYAAEALYAQRFVDDCYSWRRELERGKADWPVFNREAQAKCLEDVYRYGRRRPGPVGPPDAEDEGGAGSFFSADGIAWLGTFSVDGVDHTDLADRAVALVRRAGRGARPGRRPGRPDALSSGNAPIGRAAGWGPLS